MQRLAKNLPLADNKHSFNQKWLTQELLMSQAESRIKVDNIYEALETCF